LANIGGACDARRRTALMTDTGKLQDTVNNAAHQLGHKYDVILTMISIVIVTF